MAARPGGGAGTGASAELVQSARSRLQFRMRMVADLHIHSSYSMATSPRLKPVWLDRWARIKGIDLVGTGDCTHPAWLAELRDALEPAEEGLFRLRSELRRSFDMGEAMAAEAPIPGLRAATAHMDGSTIDPVADGSMPRFVLTGEISTIYKRSGRTRKVHHLVILPSFRAAEAFQARLERVGSIRSDGRPILGIDSRDLFAMLLESDDRSILVPAHIWTPWFSALGARSGFDSIEECYGDLASRIGAIETGLSSNPPMNWAVGSLDRFAIISNSDAHSPDRLGREATILQIEPSFAGLAAALSGPGSAEASSPAGATGSILATVEFFPQEGKYHYDGHRACGIALSPEASVQRGGICPVCGKQLTPGVLRRVLELADRPLDEFEAFTGPTPGSNRRPYYSLVPLVEILSELIGTGPGSGKVLTAYRALIEAAGSEFAILLDASLDAIQALPCPGSSGERLAEAIGSMRSGAVSIAPGFDGEYGTIRTTEAPIPRAGTSTAASAGQAAEDYKAARTEGRLKQSARARKTEAGSSGMELFDAPVSGGESTGAAEGTAAELFPIQAASPRPGPASLSAFGSISNRYGMDKAATPAPGAEDAEAGLRWAAPVSGGESTGAPRAEESGGLAFDLRDSHSMIQGEFFSTEPPSGSAAGVSNSDGQALDLFSGVAEGHCTGPDSAYDAREPAEKPPAVAPASPDPVQAQGQGTSDGAVSSPEPPSGSATGVSNPGGHPEGPRTPAQPSGMALHPAQEAAIAHGHGPALVLAGPGTGKTAVLALRIARLLAQGTDPSSILAITFTTRAAGELRTRIAAVSGDSRDPPAQASTFHAFCRSLLAANAAAAGLPEGFGIISETARKALLRGIAGSAGTASRLGTYIEACKRSLLGPGDTRSPGRPGNRDPQPVRSHGPRSIPGFDPKLDGLYCLYEEKLRRAGLLDFDDLPARAVALLEGKPAVRKACRAGIRHLCVDEYQDVNYAQYRLLRCLYPGTVEGAPDLGEKAGEGSLFVIGDPDQSIYGFRGSDPGFIRDFLQDYPDAVTYRLERSYRCAGPILEAACRMTGGSLEGVQVPSRLSRAEYPTDRAEAEGIAREIERLIGGTAFFAMDSGMIGPGEGAPDAGATPQDAAHPGSLGSLADCAVLVRAAALAPAIGKALADHGIPCTIVGDLPWWEEEPAATILATLGDALARMRTRTGSRGPLRGVGGQGAGSGEGTDSTARDTGTEEIGNSQAADKAALRRASILAGRLPGLSPEQAVLAAAEILEAGYSGMEGVEGQKSGAEADRIDRASLREAAVSLSQRAAVFGNLREFLDGMALGSAQDALAVRAERVAVMTIHAAKGLEFDHVFIAGMEEGILPFTLFATEGSRAKAQEHDPALEEERRLLYVAMTRARVGLHLSRAQKRHFRGRTLQLPPSSFLTEVADLIAPEDQGPRKPRNPQLSLFV